MSHHVVDRRPSQGVSSQGSSPAVTGPYGLAHVVRAIAVVWCLLLIVDLVGVYRAPGAWADAASGGPGWAQAEVALYASTAYLYLPVQIAAFLVGSSWLYRSRQLADALSPSFRHKHPPYRAWLAWAFPVVNLWFPYQFVRDIRRATVGPVVTTAPVRLWWLLWLVCLAADLATFVAAASAEVGSDATLSVVPWLVTGSSALGVVGGVLWLRIVQEITSAQRAGLALSGEVF
ncbi:hypothetical protein GCM10027063_46440 [Promicromonospora xylanilytica]